MNGARSSRATGQCSVRAESHRRRATSDSASPLLGSRRSAFCGPCAVAIQREAHDGEPKGRYLVAAEPVAIEPEWYAVLPGAMKMFAQTAHSPNSSPGMWDDSVARATKDDAIESAALRRITPFSAGDIRTAIGDPEADVTSVLQKLVANGKLVTWGQKRGTKYRVAT